MPHLSGWGMRRVSNNRTTERNDNMTIERNKTAKIEAGEKTAKEMIIHHVSKWVAFGNEVFDTNFTAPLVRFDLKGRTAIRGEVGESDAPFGRLLWQFNAENAEITSKPKSNGTTDCPFWGIRVNIGIAACSARNMQHLCDIDIPLQVAFLFQSTLDPSPRRKRKEWENTIKAFGLQPSDDASTFDYDLPEGTGEFFMYLCNCQGKKTPLSKTQHRKAKRGAQYCCRDCGEVLREAQQ